MDFEKQCLTHISRSGRCLMLHSATIAPAEAEIWRVRSSIKASRELATFSLFRSWFVVRRHFAQHTPMGQMSPPYEASPGGSQSCKAMRLPPMCRHRATISFGLNCGWSAAFVLSVWGTLIHAVGVLNGHCTVLKCKNLMKLLPRSFEFKISLVPGTPRWWLESAAYGFVEGLSARREEPTIPISKNPSILRGLPHSLCSRSTDAHDGRAAKCDLVKGSKSYKKVPLVGPNASERSTSRAALRAGRE